MPSAITAGYVLKHAAALGLSCSVVGVATYKAHEPIKRLIHHVYHKPVHHHSVPVHTGETVVTSRGVSVPCLPETGVSFVPLVIPPNFVSPLEDSSGGVIGGPRASSSGGIFSSTGGIGGSGGGIIVLPPVASSGGSSGSTGGSSGGGVLPPPSPVPMPGTWLMFLVGFGFVGAIIRWALRRRLVRLRVEKL